MSNKPVNDLHTRIQSYLGNGGFFNPEMMDHRKVGELLINVRDYLRACAEAHPSIEKVQELQADTRGGSQ